MNDAPAPPGVAMGATSRRPFASVAVRPATIPSAECHVAEVVTLHLDARCRHVRGDRIGRHADFPAQVLLENGCRCERDRRVARRKREARTLRSGQLRDGRAAGDQFQSILDHRGEAVVSPLYPLAHLGAARSAVLEGDIGRARARYRDFLEIWKDADADLPALKEAHVEYQRLRH